MPYNIIAIENENHQTSVLKQKAAPITFPLSIIDKQIISAMQEILYNLEGVGLAAPQINIAKQIIAIYIPESAALLRDNALPQPMHIMINPLYQALEPVDIKSDFEACYSVDQTSGKVPRFNKIKVNYQDEIGISHEIIVEGFYARVLQHEIDHLNGILITDRLTPDCLQGDKKSMMLLRRAALSKEKQELFDALLAKKGIKL